MKKNCILFSLIFILISFAFFCFAKDSGAFISSSENSNSQISINQEEILKPFKKASSQEPQLNINSGFSVYLGDKKEKVLYDFNSQDSLPIASLTKLTSAVVVMENYNLSDSVTVDADSVSTFGTAGQLKAGDIFTVKDLLYIMLIESSNDAAECLANIMGRDKFIFLMNQKAKELSMENSTYYNPSGLDMEDYTNKSSAKDITILVKHIIKEFPLLTRILAYSSLDIYSSNSFHHTLESTNILLEKDNSVLWGKTGYTEKAQDCMMVVSKTSKENDDYIITVILGADNKFEQTESILNWIDSSFVF